MGGDPSTNQGADKNRTDAFLNSPEALFVARRVQILTLAARHALPAIYHRREFAVVGGLMSYGSNIADQFRQTGNYAGRILEGENSADMPVQLPTSSISSLTCKQPRRWASIYRPICSPAPTK